MALWRPELHPRDRRGRFIEVFRNILRLNLGEFSDLQKVIKGAANVAYARVHRTREGWEVRAQTSTGTYGVRVRPEDMASDDYFENAIASLDITQPFPEYPDEVLNPQDYDLARTSRIGRLNLTKQVRRWDPEAPGGEYHLDPDLLELAEKRRVESEKARVQRDADRRRQLMEDQQMGLVDEDEEKARKVRERQNRERQMREQNYGARSVTEMWLEKNHPDWQYEMDPDSGDPADEVARVAEKFRQDDDEGRPYEDDEEPVYGDQVWVATDEYEGWGIVTAASDALQDKIQVGLMQRDRDKVRYKRAEVSKADLVKVRGESGFGRPIEDLGFEGKIPNGEYGITSDGQEVAILRQVDPGIYEVRPVSNTIRFAGQVMNYIDSEDEENSRLVAERDLYWRGMHKKESEQSKVDSSDPVAMFDNFYKDLEKRISADPGSIGDDLLSLAQARAKGRRQMGGTFGRPDAGPRKDETQRSADAVAKAAFNLQKKRKSLVEQMEAAEEADHWEKQRELATLDRDIRMAAAGNTLVTDLGDLNEGDVVIQAGHPIDEELVITKKLDDGRVFGVGRQQLRATGENTSTWVQKDITLNLENKHGWKIFKTGETQHVKLKPHGREMTKREEQRVENSVDWRADQEARDAAEWDARPDDFTVADYRREEWQAGHMLRAIDQDTVNKMLHPFQYQYEGHDDANRLRELGIPELPVAPEPLGFRAADADGVKREIFTMLQQTPGDEPYKLEAMFDFSELPELRGGTIQPTLSGEWEMYLEKNDGSKVFIPSSSSEPQMYWIQNMLRWHGRGEAQAMRTPPSEEADPAAHRAYLHQQTRDIHSHLAAILGQNSMWNGMSNVLTADEMPAGALGLARPRGASLFELEADYVIHEDIVDLPMAHITVGVHEMLHMFSFKNLLGDEDELEAHQNPVYQGFEEGVVEGAAMFLRPEIMERMGYEGDQFKAVIDKWNNEGHDYRHFVSALEDLRALTDYRPSEFYGELLMTPLHQRPKRLREMTRGVTDYEEFELQSMRTNATLARPTNLGPQGASKAVMIMAPDSIKQATPDEREAIREQFRGGFGFDPEELDSVFTASGFEARTELYPDEYGEFYEIVSTVSKDGDTIGTFKRSIVAGEGEVFNETATINDDQQGKGYGRRLTRSQLEGWKRLGLERVVLSAASGPTYNGSYTWGRFGWDFADEEDIGLMREAFRNHLALMRTKAEMDIDSRLGQGLTAQQASQILQDLDVQFGEAQARVDSLTHADEFANFRWNLPKRLSGQTFNAKEAMTTQFNPLSAENGWQARFDLSDDSRSWRVFNETMKMIEPDPVTFSASHEIETYTDPQGQTWFGKPADPEFLVDGEHAAQSIANEILPHLARSKRMRNADGRRASFQTKLDVKSTLRDVDLADLTDDQRQQIAENQVVDWLISNHDTNRHNILLLNNGDIAGIDKGQAWKGIGRDELSVDFQLKGNFGEPIYNRLWRGYIDGEYDIDLDALDEILDRIDAMDERAFKDRISRYARGVEKSFGTSPFKAMVQRKRDMRKDWDRFRKQLREAREQAENPDTGGLDTVPSV